MNSNGNHQLNSTEGQAGVKFSFVHKTSRLRFQFINKTNDLVELDSISIKHAVSKATLDIKTGELTPDETNTLMLELAKVNVNDTTTENFYIVPNNNRLAFTLTMKDGTTYTIGGEGSELNIIPQSGNSYLITLRFM